MPRPSKGPRLYLKKRAGREPLYVIRDGEKEVSTGCTSADVERASEALREYLAANFRPDTGERSLNRISCAEVMMLYLTDLPADSPSRETFRYHVKALSAYWGDKSLADVKGSTCRKYLEHRTAGASSTLHQEKFPALQGMTSTLRSTSQSKQGLTKRGVKPSTARQELKTLQAAINHWHRESPLSAVPKVSLPKPGSRRERVLERSEVARLLWACRRLSREGHKAAKGAVQYTDYSHVARFILIGLYTGTRHSAILSLRWQGNKQSGYTDLDKGIIFRRGDNEQETTKRRPPVRIPAKLACFLRSARRQSEKKETSTVSYVISGSSHRIRSIRRAWGTVRRFAGLGPDVTPHVLRHTCVSWLLWGREAKGARPAQKPMTIWEVSGVVGADASTIEKVYGHHRKPE